MAWYDVPMEQQRDKGQWHSVRLPADLYAELRRIAARENRNVSAQMRQFIVEGIEDRKRKEGA
jgi:hypothetical protein